MGRSYKEEISIVGDAKLVLKAMIEAADVLGISKKICPWADWQQEVQSLVACWKESFKEISKDGGSPNAINPYFVIASLNTMITPEDVVVADTGYMGAFAATLIDVEKAGRKYIHTAGSLGWAFPASLGAQFAVRDKGRVICIIGDGGFGYHVSDLETALRWNLPVVVIVMNNSTLGFNYHLQKFIYKDVVPEVNDFMDLDYGAVARAFGGYGEKVRRAEEVEEALKRALDIGRPALLDIAIDREIYAPVVYYESFINRNV
jgi:acetolactate synthase-1/2/3 large subunit